MMVRITHSIKKRAGNVAKECAHTEKERQASSIGVVD